MTRKEHPQADSGGKKNVSYTLCLGDEVLVQGPFKRGVLSVDNVSQKRKPIPLGWKNQRGDGRKNRNLLISESVPKGKTGLVNNDRLKN